MKVNKERLKKLVKKNKCDIKEVEGIPDCYKVVIDDFFFYLPSTSNEFVIIGPLTYNNLIKSISAFNTLHNYLKSLNLIIPDDDNDDDIYKYIDDKLSLINNINNTAGNLKTCQKIILIETKLMIIKNIVKKLYELVKNKLHKKD